MNLKFISPPKIENFIFISNKIKLCIITTLKIKKKNIHY